MIILENDILAIKLLPEMGGKIVSFFRKDGQFELAAQAGKNSSFRPEDGAGFSDYAFGMDEAFPNIDAEEIMWKGRKLRYPDHGEIWSSAFQVPEQETSSARLIWQSREFSYSYEKTLSLEGERLRIRYRIVNTGKEELPCIWTWHGLMRYEQDMEILLPEEIKHCRNVSPSRALGEVGRIYPVENPVYDFTRVPKAETKSAVKYYGEERVEKGRCGLVYPSQKVKCIVEYDAAKLPYFGVWITAGGFQGDYNCALEPSSGFYDRISKAGELGRLPVLSAGEEMEFDFAIAITESITEMGREPLEECYNPKSFDFPPNMLK